MTFGGIGSNQTRDQISGWSFAGRSSSLQRRAVDALFRACPVVELPGYSRPLIRVEDYRRLLANSTYGPDRVRPCGSRR